MTYDLFNGGKGGSKGYVKCCHSHPVLKLGNGEIVGASCGSPRDGYDIYIGFCYTMKFQHQAYPWDNNGDPVIEFQYSITDGCAPKRPAEFKKMIKWVAEQLEAGKKIHVGCIGGHGRTGTFLAALVAHMEVSDDPIKWVRKNHCKKGVESKSQVNFLHKHFGCPKHKGSKEHSGYSGTQTGRYQGTGTGNVSEHRKPARKPLSASDVVRNMPERITAMDKKGSIWG